MSDHGQDHASKCPEDSNSTDCLLRLVLTSLEKQEEAFDWDPITFAFTAPVGIFAALFAGIAIYQAFLASAAGRRKCNRRAIGGWAARTRHEWSWRDLNRLSIATTPILRSEHVGQIIASLESTESSESTESREHPGRDGRGLKAWIREQLRRLHSKVNKSPSRKDRPTATWFRFLDHVGLTEMVDDKKFALIETTMADCLPSDLLAVPAYAEVGFIVASAAAAGVRSITVGSETSSQSPYKYPVIAGNGWQFDFRQHPSLGTVGAFAFYGKVASVLDELSSGRKIKDDRILPKVALAITHSHGKVHLFFPNFLKKVPKTVGCTTNQAQYHIRMWYKEALGNDRGRLSALPWGDYMTRLFYLETGDHGLSWMILAEAPTNYIPAVFPTRLVRRNTKVLAALALSSKYWATCTVSTGSKACIIPLFTTRNTNQKFEAFFVESISGLPDELTAQDIHAVLELVENGESSFHLEQLSHQVASHLRLICNTTWFPRVSYFGPDTKNTCVVTPFILTSCINMLHSYDTFQEWFQGLAPLQKQYFRALLVLQVKEVEHWIKTVITEDELMDLVARLLCITLSLLESSNANDDGTPPHETWRFLNLVQVPVSTPVIQMLPTIIKIDKTITSFPPSRRAIYDQYDPTIGITIAGRMAGQEHERMLDGLYETLRNKYDSGKEGGTSHAAEGEIESPESHLSEQSLNITLQTETPGVGSEAPEGSKEPTQSSPSLERREPVQGSMSSANRAEVVEVTEPAENSDAIPADDSAAREENDARPNTEPGNSIEFDNGRFGEEKRTPKEVLTDVYIWRTILIAMLYFTAPDNSDLLTSGIWTHVVPII